MDYLSNPVDLRVYDIMTFGDFSSNQNKTSK